MEGRGWGGCRKLPGNQALGNGRGSLPGSTGTKDPMARLLNAEEEEDAESFTDYSVYSCKVSLQDGGVAQFAHGA